MTNTTATEGARPIPRPVRFDAPAGIAMLKAGLAEQFSGFESAHPVGADLR
jgi:hypothetical protein